VVPQGLQPWLPLLLLPELRAGAATATTPGLRSRSWHLRATGGMTVSMVVMAEIAFGR
jgi:hypothetical protein